MRFADLTGPRPVVLTLVYYECPMLCTLTLNGLLSALETLSFSPGREFDLVTVSFDHREGPALAAAKKKAYLEKYGRPGRGGGLAVPDRRRGADRAPHARGRLPLRVGRRDAAVRASGGVMVLTPDGVIARYLYGVEYAPRDLRFGIIEASERRIATALDRIALTCYQLRPHDGQIRPAHPAPGAGGRHRDPARPRHLHHRHAPPGQAGRARGERG